MRLNPNIPWKTRGNGALAIHLHTDDERVEDAKQLVIAAINDTSDPSIPSTDPAAVFLHGPITDELESFTDKALCDVVRINEATRLVERLGAQAYSSKGRRGTIGALAAIGYGPDRDHTYEIIAYRTKNNLGKPRQVDTESVKSMDLRKNSTFNNLDPETGRILICPHGPDPVLLGIRGEDPKGLLDALHELKIQEPIERVMLFKTNHGTDAHLTVQKDVEHVSSYQSVIISGQVETRPTVLRGGHVIFQLEDETGSIDCAVYQPTGSLRKVALQLIPGDKVRAMGGVRSGPSANPTLNVEKLEILELIEELKLTRPKCSACGSSGESMGRGQLLRCRKCGLRYPREINISAVSRNLRTGLYIPPPRAHRHLTKPESRYYKSGLALAMT